MLLFYFKNVSRKIWMKINNKHQPDVTNEWAKIYLSILEPGVIPFGCAYFFRHTFFHTFLPLTFPLMWLDKEVCELWRMNFKDLLGLLYMIIYIYIYRLLFLAVRIIIKYVRFEPFNHIIICRAAHLILESVTSQLGRCCHHTAGREEGGLQHRKCSRTPRTTGITTWFVPVEPYVKPAQDSHPDCWIQEEDGRLPERPDPGWRIRRLPRPPGKSSCNAAWAFSAQPR